MSRRKLIAIIVVLVLFLSCSGYAFATGIIGKGGTPEIVGVETYQNPSAQEEMTDTVTVNKAWAKTIYIQLKNEKTGKWETKKKVKTDDVEVQKLKLTYPSQWKTKSETYWRLYIPESRWIKSFTSKKIRAVTTNREEVYTTCKGAVIMNEDKEIIFSKNARKQLQNASTTKILTGILTIENLDLDTKVKCSDNAANTYWGNLYVMTPGSSFRAKDLLYALLISSSNDAATALAEKISGSNEEFAKLMNKKAKELGCTDTNFLNPHGLDTKGHYSSAYDLALMLQYATKYDQFTDAESRKTYIVRTYDKKRKQKIFNTNALLEYKGVLGGKTGSEDYAQYCFASVYEYKNKKYYVVVLGSDCDYNRWEDSKAYYEYIRKYGE